jgi:uncharacterized membrane protein
VRKNPELALLFVEKLMLFLNNPYHPKLDTHKLTGSLEGSSAFTGLYFILKKMGMPFLLTLAPIMKYIKIPR